MYWRAVSDAPFHSSRLPTSVQKGQVAGGSDTAQSAWCGSVCDDTLYFVPPLRPDATVEPWSITTIPLSTQKRILAGGTDLPPMSISARCSPEPAWMGKSGTCLVPLSLHRAFPWDCTTCQTSPLCRRREDDLNNGFPFRLTGWWRLIQLSKSIVPAKALQRTFEPTELEGRNSGCRSWVWSGPNSNLQDWCQQTWRLHGRTHQTKIPLPVSDSGGLAGEVHAEVYQRNDVR